MTAQAPEDPLISTLEEAVELLQDHGLDAGGPDPVSDTPLPSLLEQCEALSHPRAQPALRSLHHMACSGGTVIAKCLAALPETILLSEIDPLSRMRIDHPDRFAPTDLLLALRRSPREVPESLLAEIFQAAVAVALKGLAARGQTLVLRDHAHSQFCTDVDAALRPTLHEILAATGPVHAVVTLRHPLDTFLGLQARGWVRFSPATLEEFCRRVTTFLDRYDGIPIVRYEDFTADPDQALQDICTHLDLRWSPLATDLSTLFTLSGDSGRSGAVISPRARRDIPAEIQTERSQSPAYQTLCARFEYDP